MSLTPAQVFLLSLFSQTNEQSCRLIVIVVAFVVAVAVGAAVVTVVAVIVVDIVVAAVVVVVVIGPLKHLNFFPAKAQLGIKISEETHFFS